MKTNINVSGSVNPEDEVKLWSVSKHHTFGETVVMFTQHDNDSFFIIHINIGSLGKIS